MTRRLMKDTIPKIRSSYPSNSDHVLFIGWIAADFMAPDFGDPAIQGEGITMFWWEIPVDPK